MLKYHVVLLNYKRPHNMNAIVKFHLLSKSVEKVHIWDNSGTNDILDRIDDRSGRVRAHRMPDGENVGTYGRCMVCASLPVDTPVFTQDDDYICNSIDDVVTGFDGKAISAALPNQDGSKHWIYEAVKEKKPWVQLGFGSMFLAGWPVKAEQVWLNRYGLEEDEILKSKFDRIFTVLHTQHRPTLGTVTKLKNPDGKLSDSGPESLWKQRNHKELVRKAVSMAMEIRG